VHIGIRRTRMSVYTPVRLPSTLTGAAHFLAAGLPEPGIGGVTTARPRRFAAATYPLHGMLGEHLYTRLHPGGEVATEVALFVSSIPEELTATAPTAMSL